MLVPPSGVLVDTRLLGLHGLVHGFTAGCLGSARPPATPAGPPDALDRALGSSAGRWTRCQTAQVHGSRVWQVDLDGVPEESSPPEADALVTRRPGHLLVLRTADCLAVLLVRLDARGRPSAVAVAHAGWRGLLAGVVEGTVDALLVDAPRQRVVAALGPAIGPCCFEVGSEVARPWRDRLGPEHLRSAGADRCFADLPGAALLILRQRGVEVHQDAASAPCTRCHAAELHSHRAHGAGAGRMAAFIGFG